MATTTTIGFSVPASVPAVSTAHARSIRRRITPQAGYALDKLGHAIEYLTDEYVQMGGPCYANNAQLEAVQLLMALNREVYFECPEVPSLRERCRSLLRLRAA
jgi:hypothetical protein